MVFSSRTQDPPDVAKCFVELDPGKDQPFKLPLIQETVEFNPGDGKVNMFVMNCVVSFYSKLWRKPDV